MDTLKEYLLPYVISNIVFGACIFGALVRPMWTRIFLALFFLWAFGINSTLALRSPSTYLEYARLTFVPFYRDFIYGFFSRHITPFILSIAIGQLAIAIGLVLNKVWVKAACTGGIIFGLAIAPLCIGSAFPATVSTAIAFGILIKRYDHDFIWRWKQYVVKKPGLV